MKTKITLFFSAIILIISSCQKKEYTCTCSGGITGKGTTISIKSASKSNAKNECSSNNSPDGTPDGFHDCELK